MLLKIKLSFLQSMVKADSPPTKKGGKKLEGIKEKKLSNEDKTNSENIEKFLLTIPRTTWSQYLTAISSSDFLKTFATALGNSGTFQVKFGNDETTPLGNKDAYSDTYAAFLASQTQTSKEEYERFKSNYAAKNRFGQVKIKLQTFQSGFQVTFTPRLGDQTIVNVVLQKGDRGDSPNARQKTQEKVVRAIKPEITTCKISQILTSNNEANYDVASDALSSQTIMQGIKRYVV